MAEAALSQDEFCVYEHWRPDTGACFYVGKGKLRRAGSFEHRNSRYGRIVEKLKRSGMKPELRIIVSGLPERDAIAAEIERIRLRRCEGCEIANYTDGGDGTSGRLHSPQTRAKISAKARGRVLSPETIAKRSASVVGTKRSAETRAKQSAAAKVAQKERFALLKQTKRGRMALKKAGLKMSRKAANDPAIRTRRSENAIALWQDAAYREKVLSARATSRAVVKGFS